MGSALGAQERIFDSEPRDPIAPIIEKIRRIAGQFQIVSLSRQISACAGLLDQSPFVDVAILGQFKAGKSSFLNSLTGRPILPVGVIPVTTAITRLHYGPRERVLVRYFDGREEEAAVETIADFTAESRNPSNRKNVERVDVELPGLAEYAGLRLVDTPGLGSIFKYHRETSANWLPEVGAAVVAISADRPLAENDLTLIRELGEHTPRIILLLTKADLLAPEQQAEVVHFFRLALRQEVQIQGIEEEHAWSIRSSSTSSRSWWYWPWRRLLRAF